MRRENIVAGLYYPDEPDRLVPAIESAMKRAEGRVSECNATGFITPYGSYDAVLDYMTPGYVAARETDPDVILILAPAHGRLDGAIALPESQRLATPLGVLSVSTEAVGKLVETSESVCFDEAAHLSDFGIEIQLPVIRMLYAQTPVVPILVGKIGVQAVSILSRMIRQALKGWKLLIVVSANLSSFGEPELSRMQAATLLDALKNGNGETVMERGSRMINGPRSVYSLALGHQLCRSACRMTLLDRGTFTAEADEGSQTIELGSFAYYPESS